MTDTDLVDPMDDSAPIVRPTLMYGGRDLS